MRTHSSKAGGKSPFFNPSTKSRVSLQNRPTHKSLVDTQAASVSPSAIDYFGDGTSQEAIVSAPEQYEGLTAHSSVNPTK